MNRNTAPRIALALVTVSFGIYLVAMVAAVQASMNVYAQDVSGVLQLTVVAACALLAGLSSLAFQYIDNLWFSVIQAAFYIVASLSAMAGLDSDVFLHRPVMLMYVALGWFALAVGYYASRAHSQWRESAMEMEVQRRERERRTSLQARPEGTDGRLPEWEDTTLPPPRM